MLKGDPATSTCTKNGSSHSRNRVAQGQHGGGMRVLGVFENWAEKCVFEKKRPIAALVATEIVGYRK